MQSRIALGGESPPIPPSLTSYNI